MKKLLFTLVCLVLISINADAQTWLKLAGKKTEASILTPDGHEVKAGTQLELNQGTTADGNYKFIYTTIGMQPSPLGYGMDYETITVDHIRHNRKQDAYFALADVHGRLYIVEVDKAIKSGEIIAVRNE